MSKKTTDDHRKTKSSIPPGKQDRSSKSAKSGEIKAHPNLKAPEEMKHVKSGRITAGKNLRHYLFEFLMLFLAVFCGFIAENWRQNLSEHKREKVFIHSLVEDIKSDTLQSGIILTKLKGINAGIDSVLILLASPGVTDNSNEAYRLWTQSLGLEVFVSNDRTIQQLKNSGELRLIRNKAVSDRIMHFDQTLKKYYAQSNLMYSALPGMTNYSELFDFISLSKNQDQPVALTVEGKEALNRAYANLQLWNRGLIGLIAWLEVVHNEGKELMAFVQKEYRLENTATQVH